MDAGLVEDGVGKSYDWTSWRCRKTLAKECLSGPSDLGVRNARKPLGQAAHKKAPDLRPARKCRGEGRVG